MKTTWTQIKKIIDELMVSPHSYSFDFLHDELLIPLQKKSDDFEAELIARIEKDEQIIKDSSQIDLSREGEDKRDHPLVAEFWNGHKTALEEILKVVS